MIIYWAHQWTINMEQGDLNFPCLAHKIISGISVGNYCTVDEMRSIHEALDGLSSDDKSRYAYAVDRLRIITRKLSAFDDDVNIRDYHPRIIDLLTPSQKTTTSLTPFNIRTNFKAGLYRTTSELETLVETMNHHIQLLPQQEWPIYSNIVKCLDAIVMDYFPTHGSDQIFDRHERMSILHQLQCMYGERPTTVQYSSEEDVSAIVTTLLIEFSNKMTLSSGFNQAVLDYMAFMAILKQDTDDPSIYEPIEKAIHACLVAHKWSDSNPTGFITAPDRPSLFDALQKIINTYIV